jgi:hypothetical protein
MAKVATHRDENDQQAVPRAPALAASMVDAMETSSSS